MDTITAPVETTTTAPAEVPAVPAEMLETIPTSTPVLPAREVPRVPGAYGATAPRAWRSSGSVD